MLAKHLQARTKRRQRPFLLHEEGRVGLARGIVHRHDQVQRRLPIQPLRPAAVLAQHHARTRLPLPLATVSALLPLHPHQARLLQPALHQAVAQRVAVPLHQVLVEVLHVPSQMIAPVERQDRIDHSLRRRVARRPPQPTIPQRLQPAFLI
jgi:hypothetical protein